jgi:hypothetical protein
VNFACTKQKRWTFKVATSCEQALGDVGMIREKAEAANGKFPGK